MRLTGFWHTRIKQRMAALQPLFWYTALVGLFVVYNLVGDITSRAVADPLPSDWPNLDVLGQAFTSAFMFSVLSVMAVMGYGLLAVVGFAPKPHTIATGLKALNLSHLLRHTKWTDVCAALAVSMCAYLVLIFYLCADVLNPLMPFNDGNWWLTTEARFVAFLCALPLGLLTPLGPAWWRARKCKKVTLYHQERQARPLGEQVVRLTSILRHTKEHLALAEVLGAGVLAVIASLGTYGGLYALNPTLFGTIDCLPLGAHLLNEAAAILVLLVVLTGVSGWPASRRARECQKVSLYH